MVFDEIRGGDVQAEFHGAKVLVDEFSSGYLKGAVIDFSDALTGGGFKITNPTARQSCGCGKSFEA
jgi:iron-sulfur cluster assembly accessory protein